jgi:hypothetical protein
MLTKSPNSIAELRREAALEARSEALNRYITGMEETHARLCGEIVAARLTLAVATAALFGLVWKLFG